MGEGLGSPVGPQSCRESVPEPRLSGSTHAVFAPRKWSVFQARLGGSRGRGTRRGTDAARESGRGAAGVLGARMGQSARRGATPGSGECGPCRGSGEKGTAAHTKLRAPSVPHPHPAARCERTRARGDHPRPAQPRRPVALGATIRRRDSGSQDPTAYCPKRKRIPEGHPGSGRWVPTQSREARLHSHHPNPGGQGETGKSLLTNRTRPERGQPGAHRPPLATKWPSVRSR